MRPLASGLFALGLLFASAAAPASQAPRPIGPIEARSVRPEMAVATAGGPAVVALGQLQSAVRFDGGGPCGPPYSGTPDSGSAARRDSAAPGESSPYLGFYIAGGAAGLALAALAGWWFLRGRP